MTHRIIIEDCNDREWLQRQAKQARECIEDHRVIEAEEVDGWQIRLSRLEAQIERLNGEPVWRY